MKATLKASGWLKRVIEISDSGEVSTLTYSGRGFGTEKVVVAGVEKKGKSSQYWFVPRFRLKNGSDDYLVEVRIWPWLAIRSLTVEKNGTEVYAEGEPPYELTPYSEGLQIGACIALLVGVPVLLLIVFVIIFSA